MASQNRGGGSGGRGELTTARLSYQVLPPQLLPEEAEGRHPQDPRHGIDCGRASIKEEASLQLSANRQLRGPRSKGPQDPEPVEAAELW